MIFSINFHITHAKISPNQVFTEDRALAIIATDPEGDVNNITDHNLDLLTAWMGDDENHVFFTVKFDFMLEQYSFLNVTIRTETNQLYLLMIYADPSFSALLMTHATSLVQNGKNIGEECFFVDYNSTNRVQRDVSEAELSFYIDWVHLGRAHQELNIVFWAGMSNYMEYDKMPNQEFASYKPAIADRNVAFSFDPTEEIGVFIEDSQYCTDTYGGDANLRFTKTVTEEVTITETVTMTNDSIKNSEDNDTTISGVLPINVNFVFTPLFILGLLTTKVRYRVR
jgi:hypothetical protein